MTGPAYSAVVLTINDALTAKRCSQCGEQKKLLEYSPDSRAKDGKQSACMVCKRAINNASLNRGGRREARQLVRFAAWVNRKFSLRVAIPEQGSGGR